jgi:hypothetical protein
MRYKRKWLHPSQAVVKDVTAAAYRSSHWPAGQQFWQYSTVVNYQQHQCCSQVPASRNLCLPIPYLDLLSAAVRTFRRSVLFGPQQSSRVWALQCPS